MGASVKKIPAPDLTTGAPIPAEQAADLAALQNLIDTDPSAPPPPPEPEATDYATEANATVDMIAALIVGYEPKCAPHWGDDRKAGIAAALSPVMEKYNFTLGNIPPELTLLIMAAPPLYLSMKIIAEGMNKKPAQALAAQVGEVIMQPDPASVEGGAHSKEMMNL